MHILVVDDDYLQAEWLTIMLQRHFSKSKTKSEIEWVETEHEFRTRLPEFSAKPPDVIVMDVMLRWTNPSEDMPDWPDEVKKEGFYTAGFRCEELLSQTEALRSVPLIFYTVLERADLERRYEFMVGSRTFLKKPGRAYLQKSSSPESSSRAYLRKTDTSEPLVELIEQLTKPLSVS